VSQDAEQIVALMNRYVDFFDTGRLEDFAALFQNGVLRFDGLGEFAGPAEVLGFIDRMVILYDGMPRTHHLMSNVSVEVDLGGLSATARSSVLVLQSLREVPLRAIVTGRYADRFEKKHGSWCFVERTATRGLAGDVSYHLRVAANP